MSRTIPLPFSTSSSSHLLLRRFLIPFSLPSTTTTTTTTFTSLSTSKQLHSLNDRVLEYRTNYSRTSISPLNALNNVVLVDETHNSDYEAISEDKAVAINSENDAVLENETDNFNHEAAFDDKAQDSVNSKSLNNVNGVVSEEDEDAVLEEDEDAVEGVEKGSDIMKRKVLVVNAKKSMSLSVKEKKELSSYAHGLGKKLKSQQVGKSGVTDTVITALIETLEKNELLKLKIHGNCPAELDEAITQIEMGTGSVAVSQIGRTVILYRPSVSKLQAEQKKKLAQRNLMKKRGAWFRSSSQSKEELPKLTARGNRGSSRV